MSDNTATTTTMTLKKGSHVRWRNVCKMVEVNDNSGGLVKSSIGRNDKKGPKKEWKVILDDVSGEALPGEVMALMGPSGSGKTSLLDVLSGRSLLLEGSLLVDGQLPTKRYRREIAYVKQADVFFDHLTVRDQLTYTALLRLPRERRGEANRILELLRLEKCADTPIRMLSGGERKRVNIGTELLTDPRVIVLDEPTSGLDSTSAVALVQLLRDLATIHNKTVITSIHQPSSAIFFSFHKLSLLADGCLVYFGTPQNSLQYLQDLSYPCPPGYNAADHWMDLLVQDSAIHNPHQTPITTDDSSSDSAEKGQLQQQQQQQLQQQQRQSLRRKSSIIIQSVFESRKQSIKKHATLMVQAHRAKVSEGNTTKAQLIRSWHDAHRADNNVNAVVLEQPDTDNTAEKKFNTSWTTQFLVLTHRSLKNSRSAIFTPLNLIKSCALGLMAGLLWFGMDYTEATVHDRSSFFFFTMTYWVFDAMFGALFSFPMERAIIFKERASGSYHLSAYFMAKTTSEAPMRLALPFLYMIISYWLAAGESRNFITFLGSTACTLLSVLSGESLGLLIGATVMDHEKAMTVTVVVSLTLMVAGGFYVQNIPSFISWVKYLSPFKYAYDASLQIVFNRNLPCDNSGELRTICDSPEVQFVTPAQLDDILGVHGGIAFNTGMLIVLFLVPRYFALWALKTKRGAERS